MSCIFSVSSLLLTYSFLSGSVVSHGVENLKLCSRAQFRPFCQNGENLKLLLRYYLKDYRCVPYPVSFCTEHANLTNRLFQTAEECERFCLSERTKASLHNLRSLGSVRTPSVSSRHFASRDERRLADPVNLHRFANWLQCDAPPDPGYCMDNSEKYFNGTSAQCERFIYTGCGGNSNNYHSQEECELLCKEKECPRGTTPLVEGGDLYDCAAKSCPQDFKCLNTTYQSYCCPDVLGQDGESGSLKTWEPACGEFLDRGTCNRHELRFYFDRSLQVCNYFFYGGCGGNKNNFKRLGDCLRSCSGFSSWPVLKNPIFVKSVTRNIPHTDSASGETDSTDIPNAPLLPKVFPSPPKSPRNGIVVLPELSSMVDASCLLPLVVGNCSGRLKRWYWNQSSSSCQEFSYSGCGANENNFQTQRDCTTVCLKLPTDRCMQRKNPGTCNEVLLRWYYDYDMNSCNKFAFGGCGGNDNNFLSEQDCLLSCAKANDSVDLATRSSGDRIADEHIVSLICLLPLARGDCEEEEIRWYYNTMTNQCEQFVYSGCGANSNNFATRANCVIVCNEGLSLNICDHPMDEGNCIGNFTRWYFNSPDGRCKEFRYSGCGGNGNNFPTQTECQETCTARETGAEIFNTSRDNGCQQPLDVGHCHGQFIRWYFDATVKDCTMFVYTGCGGNDNIFSSKEECKQACTNGYSSHLTDGSNGITVTDRPLRRTKVELAIATPITSPAMEIERLAGSTATVEPEPSTMNPLISPFERKNPALIDDDVMKAVILKINQAAISYDMAIENSTELEDALVGIIADGNSSAVLETEEGKTVTLDRKTILDMSEILAEHIKADIGKSEGEKESELPLGISVDVEPSPVPVHPIVKLSEQEEPPSYKKCLENLDVGSCNDAITRWYYDYKISKCKAFTYHGCSGNRNHFYSKESCEEHCERFSHDIEMSLRQLVANASEVIAPNTVSVDLAATARAPYEAVSEEGSYDIIKPEGYNGELIFPQRIAVEESPYEVGKGADNFQQRWSTARSASLSNRMLYSVQNVNGAPKGALDYAPESYGIASSAKAGFGNTGTGFEETMSSHSSDSQSALLSQGRFYPGEKLRDGNPLRREVLLCPIGEQPLKTAGNNLLRCLPGQDHCPANSLCYYNGLDFHCCSHFLVRT